MEAFKFKFTVYEDKDAFDRGHNRKSDQIDNWLRENVGKNYFLHNIIIDGHQLQNIGDDAKWSDDYGYDYSIAGKIGTTYGFKDETDYLMTVLRWA